MVRTHFDWDDGNWPKCGKHGVSPEEIEYALVNEPLIAPDQRHSADEERLIAIGHNAEGRAMFVAITYRRKGNVEVIRPISARYMHAKELKRYAPYSSRT
ncbi:BrnT family toxin [Nitratireductor basaltis]|uniref:BrnT family toxin n=1 Tax=Nitratireductor basaltis TaxID=472175 RepID=A0A084U7Y0_9HYPH|nr:BrnT family toxin [Nitratireductor basaltis]KFB09066.1 hypothetical protein EL18_00080 [Nitratireductor basaltis]